MSMHARIGALVGVAGLALAPASAGVIPASIVVGEGDAVAGSTVSLLNAPFTNGIGEVGFVFGLEDGRRGIWIDDGPVFTSDDALPDDVLTGGEGTMGIGDEEEWIYSPSFNGDDSVYGEDGLILVENTQAPDFPPDFATTFHSRPRMINDGTAYWIAGINDGAGGSSTQSRVIYERTQDGTITGILRAGDVIDGVTVDIGSGIDFDFSISDDGARRMFVFDDTGAGGAHVAVDGAIVASEGLPTGGGDNWDNFDAVDVNVLGNHVFSGDTDAPSTADEFIAYNGAIALRQGDTVDGLTLGSSVDALSINDLNQAVFIWDTEEQTETLFFAEDADVLGSATSVVSVGDELDADDDGTADWIVTDFNASGVTGPGLDFAENGVVYAELDIESPDGVLEAEAVVRFLIAAAPCNAADLADPFGVLDLNDLQAFVAAFNQQDSPADLAPPFNVYDLNDVQAFVASFNAGCP